jgi:hypothetical protein
MKSREFFSSIKEKPLVDSVVKKIEGKNKRRLLRLKSQDALLNREFYTILEKIDFEGLKEIFKNDLLRSGIDQEEINFVPPSKIYNMELEKLNMEEIETSRTMGTYLFLQNIIGIDYKFIKENYINPEITLLGVIAHEETHAASKLNCYGAEKLVSSDFAIINQQLGYQKGEYDYEKASDYFDEKLETRSEAFLGFDEGVTELYTWRNIMTQYLSTHLEFANFNNDVEVRKFCKQSKNFSYQNEVKLVIAFFTKMAMKTESFAGEAWKSLIHGKFSGVNFYDKEVRELFDEAFGKKFMDKLSAVNPGDHNLTLECLKELRGDDSFRKINAEEENLLQRIFPDQYQPKK